jgi:single-strand DNA-binding protein
MEKVRGEIMDLSNIQLIGNVGEDAVLRSTPGGSTCIDFTMATNEKDDVTWYKVVMWGKQAENIVSYVTKGTRLFVSGKFKYSTWEKDGEKHHALEVTAKDVVLLGKRDEVRQTISPVQEEIEY